MGTASQTNKKQFSAQNGSFARELHKQSEMMLGSTSYFIKQNPRLQLCIWYTFNYGVILKSRGQFFGNFNPPPPKWPLLLYKVYRVK